MRCSVCDSANDPSAAMCWSCGSPLATAKDEPHESAAEKLRLAEAEKLRLARQAKLRTLIVATSIPLICLVLLLIFRPCFGPQCAAGGPAQYDLRLHGSTTIGDQLAADLARAYLTASGARDVTSTVQGSERFVSGTLPNTSAPIRIEIDATSSGNAFKDLASGRADIGMASRRIVTPADAGMIPDPWPSTLGDPHGRSAEHVIGVDGVAIIVHHSNPVARLTISQLRGIFSGSTTDWRAVGGQAGPIHVLTRDSSSGTRDALESLVMAGQPITRRAREVASSDAMTRAVADDPSAVGYVTMALAAPAKPLEIAASGDTTPLLPDPLTVGIEAYPLTRRLYLYTSANAGALVSGFVHFVQSIDSGQKVLDSDGFVGVDKITPRSPCPADAPPEYLTICRGAHQLAYAIRFESGSTQLDNKGQDSIGYTVTIMSRPPFAGHRLVLAGFADSTGTDQQNDFISQQRADAVATALRNAGVSVARAAHFGKSLPIADNATPNGREKNRRVELWALGVP